MHLQEKRWINHLLTHAFATCIYKDEGGDVWWTSTNACIYNNTLFTCFWLLPLTSGIVQLT